VASNAPHHPVLSFGPESELTRFHLQTPYFSQGTAFVRFSEPILRRFRSHPELHDIFTEEHIRKLKRETDGIIMAYETTESIKSESV
jgi:hypothetical protein